MARAPTPLPTSSIDSAYPRVRICFRRCISSSMFCGDIGEARETLSCNNSRTRVSSMSASIARPVAQASTSSGFPIGTPTWIGLPPTWWTTPTMLVPERTDTKPVWPSSSHSLRTVALALALKDSPPACTAAASSYQSPPGPYPRAPSAWSRKLASRIARSRRDSVLLCTPSCSDTWVTVSASSLRAMQRMTSATWVRDAMRLRGAFRVWSGRRLVAKTATCVVENALFQLVRNLARAGSVAVVGSGRKQRLV